MKTPTTLKNAIGKTLTDYAESCWGQTLLIFGDEYVCFGVGRGNAAGEDTVAECDLDVFRFGEALFEKGVISQQESAALLKRVLSPNGEPSA